MLSEFDKLVKQRDELKSWWRLGQTIARYDNDLHLLRVDMLPPSLVTFCGQDYAGAKNYHDAPKSFYDAVRKEMSARAEDVAAVAYETEIERLDALIESHREAVLKQLASA